MANYLLVYYGGKMETDPKKAQASMGAWLDWFKSLGQAVVDGGAPTQPGKTISSSGIKNNVKGEPITGYSILKAASMDAVVDMAKKCPHLAAGGQIAIYSTMPMQM